MWIPLFRQQDVVIEMIKRKGREHCPHLPVGRQGKGIRQRQQIDTTKNLLAEGRDITALDNITEYFRRLYRIKGESLDIKKILDKFKDGNYQFATVAGEFNLIEENTVTVYINREPEAEALLQEILQQGLTKSRMRRAGQYCVNVRKKGEYEKEICCLKKCIERHAERGTSGCTGFLRADAGGTIQGRHRVETGSGIGRNIVCLILR